MIVALWILNAVLALIFLFFGARKVILPREALEKSGMTWVTNVSPGVVKLLGFAEVLGAAGLIVPLATGIAVILTPIAACCLLVVMVGALVVHIRHGENPAAPAIVAVLLLASAIIGWIVVA